MNIKCLNKITVDFSVKIIKLSEKLRKSGHSYIASRLEIRGCKIGAYIARAADSFSRGDALFELKRAYRAILDTQKLLDTLYATKRISGCKYKELSKKCSSFRESVVTLCKLIK